MDDAGGAYTRAASEAVQADVLAAALFEPNVPDFVGGIAGVVTAPARWRRLQRIGVVTTDCLLAVAECSVHCLKVRLHVTGFELEEEIVRWVRADIMAIEVPVATWALTAPPWSAIRILEHGMPVAELKPTEDAPSYRAVLRELLGVG